MNKQALLSLAWRAAFPWLATAALAQSESPTTAASPGDAPERVKSLGIVTVTGGQDLGNGLARATLFHETTRDALHNQLIGLHGFARTERRQGAHHRRGVRVHRGRTCSSRASSLAAA